MTQERIAEIENEIATRDPYQHEAHELIAEIRARKEQVRRLREALNIAREVVTVEDEMHPYIPLWDALLEETAE